MAVTQPGLIPQHTLPNFSPPYPESHSAELTFHDNDAELQLKQEPSTTFSNEGNMVWLQWIKQSILQSDTFLSCKISDRKQSFSSFSDSMETYLMSLSIRNYCFHPFEKYANSKIYYSKQKY